LRPFLRTHLLLLTLTPACSCDYFCKFQFRPIHPPSRRLSDSLCETILKEAHDLDYSIHPVSTKMYQDLKQKFWWYGLKRDVAARVAICNVC
jgi:hypothetical protein